MLIIILSLVAGINTSYGFNLSSARWASAGAEVRFSSTMAPEKADGLKSGLWIDQFKTAFSRWTDADSVTYTLTYSSEDCGNDCTINNDRNEMYWMDSGVEPINIPAGALAVTLRRQYDNNMVEVDIVVNKDFDHVLINGAQASPGSVCVLGAGPAPGYSNCFDLPSIVTHEIGHFFGLDHSSEDPDLPADDPRRLATMYYSLAPDGLLFPLKEDDVAGMDCLYPSVAQGEPFKVEACCQSYSPFDRAPGCSHAFSNEPDAQSLDIGGNTSGCGYIKDIDPGDGNSGDASAGGKNIPGIFFVLLVPLLMLVSNRIIFGIKA